MTYKDNQPTFNVNRKVVNFKDFLANPNAEKEELEKMDRQNKPNSDEYQKNFANSRYKYNKVTHKMDDLSPAEIEDKIDAIDEFEGTNENIDDEFDMASSHLDDESIQYHKAEKQKIKNILEGVLDDISADLEEFTNAVSGEININDTLYSSFGDYEYEIKIKRIS